MSQTAHSGDLLTTCLPFHGFGSSNLLFHCFARDFIHDNGVCNVLNETEIVANFRKRYGDQFCRFLDHNFGKYRRLLQSCFSRNRSFQHYRYSKCHISGNKLNVDGIEVSSFCSECALFEYHVIKREYVLTDK